MPSSTVDLIRAALDVANLGAGMPVGWGRPQALGWATVELDRAASELARDLGFPVGAFRDAIGSEALGAHCRVVHGALPDGLSLAILEPATEGRLAATLARFGEGPVVVWYTTDEGVSVEAVVGRAGPFGPERLVTGDPVHGPHRFLIGPRAGTIQS